jgi:biotin carboxylase
MNFPLIVKPVDLTGGKGMSICRDANELQLAVSVALSKSRQEYVVVEEYLRGTNHGLSLIIKERKVVWSFADDEQYFMNPFLVAGTTTPTTLDPQLTVELFATAGKIAEHLELVDGILHLQLLATTDDVYILEACRRCPGDLYPEFIHLSTGFDYASQVVKAELGHDLLLPQRESTPHPTARHCAMASQKGLFVEVLISRALSDSISRRVELMSAGDQVQDHLVQKQEIIFLEFSSVRDKDAYLSARDALVEVRVQEDHQ